MVVILSSEVATLKKTAKDARVARLEARKKCRVTNAPRKLANINKHKLSRKLKKLGTLWDNTTRDTPKYNIAKNKYVACQREYNLARVAANVAVIAYDQAIYAVDQAIDAYNAALAAYKAALAEYDAPYVAEFTITG